MVLAVLGALVGLCFALVEYWMFGALIARAASRGETGQGPRMLDLARKIQLILFPVAGFVIGWLIEGESGVL